MLDSRYAFAWRCASATGTAALACVLAISAGSATGQTTVKTPPPTPTQTLSPAPTPSPTQPAAIAGAASQVDTAPLWSSLSQAQQTALRPLAPFWREITPNRKRKWLALSANFSKLSPSEQVVLHGRMTEWAMLSNTERNRARLNFAETRSLSSEEKKAQWEAYQALSPTQKQQLARQAPNSPRIGAAATVTTRTPGKLAAVPVTRSSTGANHSKKPEQRPLVPARPASAAQPGS